MSAKMIFDNISYHCERYGIEELVISGGEPTDRRDLVNIFQHGLSHGIKEIYLHTNATNPLCETRKVISEYVNRIMVSYQGIGGHAKTTDDLIRFFLAQGVALRTNTVLLKTNLYDVNEIIEHVFQIGVQRMLFTFPIPIGFTKDGNNPLLEKDPCVLCRTVCTISQFCESKKIKYSFQGFPACFLYPYHDKIDPWVDRYVVDYYHQFELHQLLFDELLNRSFDKVCVHCKKRSECNGFWPDSWHSSIFKLKPFQQQEN